MTITPLRKRFIEDLQLAGMSPRTQEVYVGAVRQLAEHYGKSPDLVCDEELRDYFLHLRNVKGYSRSASTIALCGIKFFVEKTLYYVACPMTLSLHDRCQRIRRRSSAVGAVGIAPILGRRRRLHAIPTASTATPGPPSWCQHRCNHGG